jgi:hypothetical protein
MTAAPTLDECQTCTGDHLPDVQVPITNPGSRQLDPGGLRSRALCSDGSECRVAVPSSWPLAPGALAALIGPVPSSGSRVLDAKRPVDVACVETSGDAQAMDGSVVFSVFPGTRIEHGS